jgi:Structure-specific recognition protein (SSRP1)
MSASGRNWGDAVVDNETLQFSVGSKPLFSVALPDVTQVSSPGSAAPKKEQRQ